MQTEDPLAPRVSETVHTKTTSHRVEETGPVPETVVDTVQPEPQYDGMAEAADAVVAVLKAIGDSRVDRETGAQAFLTLRDLAKPALVPSAHGANASFIERLRAQGWKG